MSSSSGGISSQDGGADLNLDHPSSSHIRDQAAPDQTTDASGLQSRQEEEEVTSKRIQQDDTPPAPAKSDLAAPDQTTGASELQRGEEEVPSTRIQQDDTQPSPAIRHLEAAHIREPKGIAAAQSSCAAPVTPQLVDVIQGGSVAAVRDASSDDTSDSNKHRRSRTAESAAIAAAAAISSEGDNLLV